MEGVCAALVGSRQAGDPIPPPKALSRTNAVAGLCVTAFEMAMTANDNIGHSLNC